MKALLITLLIFLGLNSFAQSGKFHIGVEYAPAVTGVTYDIWWNPYKIGLSPVQNVFIRTDMVISPKFEITSGLGFITARNFRYLDIEGHPDVDNVASHYFHQYFVLPLGFKYKFGSFFIQPDIGIGINVENKVKSHFVLTDGSEGTSKSKDLYVGVNNLTYPISFGFGNEITLKSCSVQMGVRGYYSLNGISSQLIYSDQHYYGFGVFGGVRF